jgi:hypothetical protein
MPQHEQIPPNEHDPVANGSDDHTLPAINHVIDTMGVGSEQHDISAQLFEEYNPAHEAWGKSLDVLSETVAEVAADREAIERGGRILLDELEINSSLFEGVSHTLMFAALGQRKARLEENREALDSEAYDAENTFIRNATMLLALQRSGLFEQLKHRIYNYNVYAEAAVEKAYDRFTNVQVTAELQTAIDNGLLDEVKARLSVTEDNEDPYVLRVLNVGDNRSMRGMHPTPVIGDDDPEKAKEWREAAAAFDEYQRGLDRNNQEFMGATGSPTIPLAWMVPLRGRRHLCIALPTAEKILYDDDVHLGRRRQDDGVEERAIVEHEYTHTQGSYALDQQIFYGIGLEERRAELFANDKMGYKDIKGMIDFDFTPLIKISLLNSMRGAVKGGDPDKLYAQLAERIGLQNTLEIALTAPSAYITDAYPMQRDVQEYLGGINGLEERIYERMDADDRAFFDEVVDIWATNNAPRDIESWLDTRERQFGLGFVTQKLREALQVKRAESGIEK